MTFHRICLKTRSIGEGNGNPLQYSCLEKSMDRGAWRAAVHGLHDWARVHEGGGRQVGSNKLIELKKEKRKPGQLVQLQLKGWAAPVAQW